MNTRFAEAGKATLHESTRRSAFCAMLAGLTLATLLAALALAAPSGGSPQPPALDEPVAYVDRILITRRDLRLWVFERRLDRPELAGVADLQVEREVLTDAVDEALLAYWGESLDPDEAQRIDVQPDAAAAVRRYETAAGGPRRLRALMDDAGIDEADLLEFARARARANHFIRRAVATRVDDRDLPPVVESPAAAVRLRLGEIAIAADGPQDAAAFRRALAVRREIAGGLDFEEAARRYSDAASARRSGDLGWIDVEALAPSLRAALQPLALDDVTSPVLTASGYSLFQLSDFETPRRAEYLRRYADAERRELDRLRRERDVRLSPGWTLRPVPAPLAPLSPSFLERYRAERAGQPSQSAAPTPTPPAAESP